jgi:hypothetical protein
VAASALEACGEDAEVLYVLHKLHGREGYAKASAGDDEEDDDENVERMDAVPATQQPQHPPASNTRKRPPSVTSTEKQWSYLAWDMFAQCCHFLTADCRLRHQQQFDHTVGRIMQLM